MTYETDFYAGMPALTVNLFGKGKAYHVCADFEQGFYDEVYRKIAKEAGVKRVVAHIPEGVEVFDVKGPFFFGAVEQFKDQVLETLEHDTKVVILRMRLVPALDATGLNVLSDFCHQCREHGSTLLVCGVQPQPLDVIRHAPFYRELKRYNICENIDAALNRARKIINGPAPKHL